MGSQKAGLIDSGRVFQQSYKVLQASSSSAAAEAVKKLAQRFAAGSGELAELVRKDQDLAVEADRTRQGSGGRRLQGAERAQPGS